MAWIENRPKHRVDCHEGRKEYQRRVPRARRGHQPANRHRKESRSEVASHVHRAEYRSHPVSAVVDRHSVPGHATERRHECAQAHHGDCRIDIGHKRREQDQYRAGGHAHHSQSLPCDSLVASASEDPVGSVAAGDHAKHGSHAGVRGEQARLCE